MGRNMQQDFREAHGTLEETDSWVAWDGAAQRTLTVGVAGEFWDVVWVEVVLTATAGGAATYRARISATTGWTNGDSTEHYTSAVTPVADDIVDSIPFMPAMFKLTASTLFYRVVPDAGTTTGSITIFARQRLAA